MSKLLLDEEPLLIMPNLAVKIGLNESIILQQIHYWKNINEKAKRNFNDGYYWTYNTYEEWKNQFPFWSEKTIYRTIKELEKLKILVIGNYNKTKIDRTKWYRIDYFALEVLETSPFGQIDQSNRTKWLEHLDKMTKAIPKTSSEITTDILKEEENTLSVTNYYSDILGRKLNKVELEALLNLKLNHSAELVIRAIDEMVLANKGNSIKYLKTVLSDWNSKNLTTVELVDIYLSEREVKRDKKRKQDEKKRTEVKDNKPSSGRNVFKDYFGDYEQREYSKEELKNIENRLNGWPAD